ncbi:type IV toxin-antitoxin system AbiEi family antitoxin domain-containing protein [Dietzia sp. PP-33]|jgi:hypothetical protein|uniref:type IV toxin-antitoxin system AbiEi family antitoxin domain-containing protein n=1 Tax=Dietzia sp. PP-33 TaxID=2957500 RepID=UPI0029A137A5|nr:type IV toxin-antitoxin system AbiEi family antitoxin domain-containing protein [Dietzia sp. PP-33]MDX2357345.1 hypothetical protein [Dietzia sp. PP-33]
MTIDELRPLVQTTEKLLGQGMTPQALSRATASGELIRLRPGFYVGRAARGLGREEKHLLSVLAADMARDSPVFSHASAALILGLPSWGLPLRRVAVSAPGQTSRTRSTRLIKHHTVPLGDDDIIDLSGLRVTGPERTVTDIALTAGRDAAVAIADASINSGLAGAASLERAVLHSAGRSGVRKARVAMGLVDGRSESVAETLSRLTFTDFGLPEPELQANIVDTHGNRIARVDFLWREYGVIGECDGFGKYFDGATPADTRRRLGMEKDRDAELVALGYRVLHWRWADLDQPRFLAERVRRVLYAAAA